MGRICKEQSGVEKKTELGLRVHSSSWILLLIWMLSILMCPLVGWSKKPSNTTWTTGQNMKVVTKMLKSGTFVLLKKNISLERTPDTLWGFGAGWYVPPSSESLVPLSEPKAASPPAHCPSAAPSDSPAPPPEADSRRPDRGALALAPPQGSGAALACVGCGRLHPGGGNSLKSLGRREQHAALSRHRALNLKPLILPSVLLAFSPFHCIPF